MPPPKPSPWRNPKGPPPPALPTTNTPSAWSIPVPSGHISAPFIPSASTSLSSYLAQGARPSTSTSTTCTNPNCPYDAHIAAFHHFEINNDMHETGYMLAVPKCLSNLSERTKTNVLLYVLDEVQSGRAFKEGIGRAVRELRAFALGGGEVTSQQATNQQQGKEEEEEEEEMSDAAMRQLPIQLNGVKDYITQLRAELEWARRREREKVERLGVVEGEFRALKFERLSLRGEGGVQEVGVEKENQDVRVEKEKGRGKEKASKK